MTSATDDAIREAYDRIFLEAVNQFQRELADAVLREKGERRLRELHEEGEDI